MAERATTGNGLLDVWINALTSMMPADAVAAMRDAAAPGPQQQSGLPWERMFFSDPTAPVGTAFQAGATGQFAELWSDLAQRSVGVIAALGATANAGDPLGKALEESFGVIGDVSGAAANVPALLAQAAKASSVLYAAREAYRAFVFVTWQRALEEVTREAVRRAGEGQAVESPAQWLSLSNAVADRVFVQAFHSQPYIDLQRKLSSALADQRHAELELVEIFAQFGRVLTPRALDDIGEAVSDLRRRVRRLERASGGARQRRRKSQAVDAR